LVFGSTNHGELSTPTGLETFHPFTHEKEGHKGEFSERVKPKGFRANRPGRCAISLPIDRSEWEQGTEPATTEAQILTFLKSQPGRAFSLSEIIDGVRGLGRLFHGALVRMFLGELPEKLYEELYFRRALENLVREGEVKARVLNEPLGNSIYYIAA
jgi:hypothetical protein